MQAIFVLSSSFILICQVHAMDTAIALYKQAIKNDDHTQVVKLMKTNHNLKELKDRWGYTPMHYTIMFGKHNIYPLFSKHNKDIKFKNKYTPLHTAAVGGHVDMMRLLLSQNSDNLHALADNNYTPLHSATMGGSCQAVSFLLSRGAEPNRTGSSAMTPLHIAAAEGYEDIVHLLLLHDADVDAQNDEGNTPLHVATDDNEYSCILTLLFFRADPRLKNTDGKTPIQMTDDETIKDILSSESKTNNPFHAHKSTIALVNTLQLYIRGCAKPKSPGPVFIVL